ncbi:hypothetical protein [Halogranum amylolyticum]|uniref:hypothetical protein n=1 Tax=Halogranum amylolyticum TaxID=660520 RepID=UPI001114BFA5|nr:hypothetical protein [Halogranum amylolyticum]
MDDILVPDSVLVFSICDAAFAAQVVARGISVDRVPNHLFIGADFFCSEPAAVVDRFVLPLALLWVECPMAIVGASLVGIIVGGHAMAVWRAHPFPRIASAVFVLDALGDLRLLVTIVQFLPPSRP